MLLLSCDLPASVMARIMPFLWPHGIVKDAHFRIIWICILLCTVNLEPLLFSHTVFIYVIVGKYAIWMQPFFRRNRLMKEWLSQSFWNFINLLGRCTDCQFLPWGGDLHHLMDLVSFWTSYMLEKRQPLSPKNSQLSQNWLSPAFGWLFFSSQYVGLQVITVIFLHLEVQRTSMSLISVVLTHTTAFCLSPGPHRKNTTS